MLSLSGCGQHDSESFGFTNSVQGKQGEVLNKPEEFLKQAIDISDREKFEKILNDGINLNVLLSNGRTPLTHATASGNTLFVHLLLNKGADAEFKDLNQKKALDYATELQNNRIILLLDSRLQEQKQKDLFNIILNGVVDEDVDSVDKILKEGVNPNFLIEGESPLTKSIELKLLGTFKTIARWKDPELSITMTNVNLPNGQGFKPLKLAREKTNKNFIKVLVELSAEE